MNVSQQTLKRQSGGAINVAVDGKLNRGRNRFRGVAGLYV
jgi:hypothetical protein